MIQDSQNERLWNASAPNLGAPVLAHKHLMRAMPAQPVNMICAYLQLEYGGRARHALADAAP